MSIDTTRLKELRFCYAFCRRHLGVRTKAKQDTSLTLATMNRVRGKLIREIKRVSWLVWPTTGRPGG